LNRILADESVAGPAGSGAYNPAMFHALNALVAPAAIERLTLLVNHVLASEPVATDRLKRHTGRRLRLHLEHWPTLLPTLPAMVFLVTPAGMLEWGGPEAPAEADLQVLVDASNPARLVAQAMAGETPALEIQGDAALATDVNWLVDHLRWDVEADLEPLVGPRAAHQIVRVGSALGRGFKRAAVAAGRVAAGPGAP
jgi:ubiquinone biosynthesis protein UbiJ